MEKERLTKKRKKIVLTIKQKLTLIERFEKGESMSKLSEEYGIGIQTVRDIVKQKNKLEAFARDCDSSAGPSKRKSMKTSTFEDLDAAMLIWFNQKRAEGIPISGQMCIEAAKTFHENLGIKESFNASSGWMTRFKQRHGIRQLTIQGERLSSNAEAVDEFCVEFQEYLQRENLQPDQIYNADETGLYWKCLPTKTLASMKEKSAPGHKSSKERITVMCCGNASGTHKMKLVVIGKAKKPRSFKGTEIKNLPVDYYSQKGAWMNREIFEDWFKKKWVPEVQSFLKNKGLPQKAVLLLDNAPSHPHESILKTNDGLMVSKFLPPNVTSLIQPMDQGVLSSMKRLYRQKLLKTLVEEDDNLINFWKKMTVLDAIHGIAQSWSKIKPVTLLRSWRSVLPDIETDLMDSEENKENVVSEMCGLVLENLNFFEDVDKENIEEWLNHDLNDPGFERMDDPDIVSLVTQKEENDSNTTSEEDTSGYVSHETALNCIETLLDYTEQRGTEYNNVIALRIFRSEIRNSLKKSQKQMKITDFF